MDELSLADYLAIFKRRKKYFLLTFAALMAASAAFALSWSNYRSTATVEIEQPEINSDVTIPTNINPADVMGTLADLRIGKIEQRVTAPASLIDIIDKFDLYPDARRLLPMESVADRMRGKIRLNLIGSTVANPEAAQKVPVSQLSASAFTLSFDYNNPQTAQEVTNELVTRFLDEDMRQRRDEAEATSVFLGQQITALGASMADQEKKIAAFEQVHGFSGPDALMFDRQAAETTAFNLQGLDSQVATNEGTEGNLRAQLATVDPYSRVIADGQVLTTPAIQLKALEARYATLTAEYGPEYPDVLKTHDQIEALRKETGLHHVNDSAQLKAQIESIRTNLKAARKSYGPRDPDVVSLRQQLEKLQHRLADTGKGQMAADGIKEDADNPAYLELVAQLRAAEAQHKSLLAQRTGLSAEQAKYQEAVARNPGLEQQMAELTRDYENAQLRYRQLKERKMLADMKVQMIEQHKGERLSVINPPTLPAKTHPSRLMLLIAGFVLSVLGGIGAVVLVQSINQGVLGTRHLAVLVGVPPLVAIPHISTAIEVGRTRQRRPYLVGGAAALAIIGAITFNFFVMPFDVLGTLLMQRFGSF
ncbi:MAG TPA: hypothetical protein VMV79_00895 [Alphaproteobacteria bacterium]|nr:hypothetical protein [Alphaproteobacteria bacterium]